MYPAPLDPSPLFLRHLVFTSLSHNGPRNAATPMYWSTLAIVPHGDNRTRQETGHTTRPSPWPLPSPRPSAIGWRGAAAGLGFLGCANALLMSAKTFEMATGGGGEALRRTTTSWGVTRLEGQVRRRAVVTPPALLLNLVPLSSSYLETDILLSLALAANALQPAERKLFLLSRAVRRVVCGHMRARTCAMQPPV